jgi:predicted lipid carrier protein YhbT
MSTVQANFLIPAELLAALRALVPKGKQSKVVTNALKNEFRRIQFRKTLEESFGAWKKEEHLELQKGTKHFIRKLRSSTRATRKN